MLFTEQFSFLGPASSQVFILRGESLSRASEGSGRSQGEAAVRSLEDRVERLQREVHDLKAAKKEAGARCQKVEKEVRRLQREMKALQEEHAEELRVYADQVCKEFPKTEEGKNLLKTCWASRLAEHKKSEAYEKEVALVAGPFCISPLRLADSNSWPRGILLPGRIFPSWILRRYCILLLTPSLG
ncbi:UNVERIFIED_CONTAM: hypothetical protein Sradi_1434100 [Sesamum radiatum]|uniref:Uncharacterized protein n=1 Tax=Sesamum radiatum TaxID=300843 RepID=A0AAW2U667_SESRA